MLLHGPREKEMDVCMRVRESAGTLGLEQERSDGLLRTWEVVGHRGKIFQAGCRHVGGHTAGKDGVLLFLCFYCVSSCLITHKRWFPPAL